MGDFNIDITNNINSKINQLMHQLGLTPLIHSNTRQNSIYTFINLIEIIYKTQYYKQNKNT